MILRINWEHYLSHAIDYFTKDELLSFRYIIISAMISHNNLSDDVKKLSQLYPRDDVILVHDNEGDLIQAEKLYIDWLMAKDTPGRNFNGYEWATHPIGMHILKPLTMHQHVMILCTKDEDWIIDSFCKYLKLRYELDVFDLNQFFATGQATQISINPDAAEKAYVKSVKQANDEGNEALESTAEGRYRRLLEMSKKQLLRKAEEVGIDTKGMSIEDVVKDLVDAWVLKH